MFLLYRWPDVSHVSPTWSAIASEERGPMDCNGLIVNLLAKMNEDAISFKFGYDFPGMVRNQYFWGPPPYFGGETNRPQKN